MTGPTELYTFLQDHEQNQLACESPLRVAQDSSSCRYVARYFQQLGSVFVFSTSKRA